MAVEMPADSCWWALRLRAGVAFITVLALVLTACVAGPSGPSPTGPHGFEITTTLRTTTTNLTLEQGLENYRSCMSDQGVPIPEIELDTRKRPHLVGALADLDLAARPVLDAFERCGRHLSTGALALGSDPDLRELIQQRLDDFAECVRLSGASQYPDPVSGFDGVGSPFPVSDIPWDDPDLPDAVSACRRLLGA